MNRVFFTSRAITYAQRMERILRKNGIPASIERPELRLGENGCAYAVVISQGYLPEAVETLRRGGMIPVKIFLEEDFSDYREIKL